jgi:C4-type Zn-finger protein
MARYLARACPRCNGYVGITMREPGRNVPLQAVNGHCSRCQYRLAWIVIGGKGSSRIITRKLRSHARKLMTEI